MQVTPHFSKDEILRVSSSVESTVFKDKPFELALRMTAVFSRLELGRLILNGELQRNPTTAVRIILTSYLRSLQHNVIVGGSTNSRHLHAIAIDLQFDDQGNRRNIIEEEHLALLVFGDLFDYAMVTVNPNECFIHADLRDTFGDVA